MRYLKSFNESIDNYKEELIEFCDNHLAYLIDIGFKIEVESYDDKIDNKYSRYEIKIYKASILYRHGSPYNSTTKYDWIDINDDIIPFITMLDTKYNIIKTEISYLDLKNWSDIDREFSIEEIKKDEIDIENINSIFIDIVRKN